MPTDYVPSRDRQPHVREMRYDRGERDRSVLGKRDWHRTSPFGSFERSGSLAPVNGASLGPPSKRRPPGGRHGFSSENGRYNREYGRSSELPSLFVPPYPEKSCFSHRCERGSYPLAGNGSLYAGNPVFDDSDKHLTERSILSRDGREMPSHSHFYHADADRPFTNSSSSAYSPNLDSNKGMELRGWHALYRQDREPKDKVIRSECNEKKSQAKVDPPLDWSAQNHDIEGRLDRYGSSARGESTMTSWLNYSDFSSTSVDWNSKEALPSVTSSSLVGSLKTVARNHSERTSHTNLFTSSLEKSSEEKVSPPKPRPRLGWGQGLAKYEKKKVEGSDEPCNSIDGQARNDIHMEMEDRAIEASGGFQSSDNGSTSPLVFDYQPGITNMVELEGFKLEEHNKDTPLAVASSGSDFLVSPAEVPESSPMQDVLEEAEAAKDIIQSDQEVLTEPELMSDLQVITSFPEVSEVAEVVEVATFESDDSIQEVPNSEATACIGIAGELSKEMVLLKIEKVEYEIDLAEKELLKFEKVGVADYASFPTEDCVENDGVEDMKIDEGCKSPFQQLDYGAIDVSSADQLQERSEKNEHQIWPAAGCYFHALPLLLENQELAAKARKALAHLVKMDEKEQRGWESYASLTDTPVWKANQETHNRIKKNMQGRLAEEKEFLQFKVKLLALKYKMIKQLENLEQSSANHKRERSKMLRKSETENKIGLSSTNQRITARLKPSSRSDHSMLSGFTKIDAMTEEESSALKKVIDLPVTKLRDSLRMPPMVLDPKEGKSQCFITTNALVEDPVVFENERKGINPWTAEETQIFLEKFAVYSKNFKKIASFLEHKTTGDCVEFYYRNKKHEDFEKLSRRQQLKKRHYTRTNSYLAGSCSRFKDLSADAASETLGGQALSSACYSKVMRTSAITDDVLENASVLKSIMARESKQSSPPAVTSGAVSGAITGLCNLSKDVGPFRASRERPSKTFSVCKENCTKPKGMRSSHTRRESTKIASDDAECQWTDGERELFTKAVVLFGKDFKSIALHVGSKTQGQCKTFYSKTRKRLGLDSLVLQCQSSLQDAAVPSFDDVKTLTSEDMEGVEFADKEMMDVTEHFQPVSRDVDANVFQANVQNVQCKFSASEEILRTDEVFEQMESPAALQQSGDIVVSSSEQIYVAHQNSAQKLTQLKSPNAEDDAENSVSPDEECISSTAEKVCSFDFGVSTGTTAADAMPVHSFAVSDASSMSENHERGDSTELIIKIERESEAGIGEDNLDVKPLPQGSVSESAVRHSTGKSKAPTQNAKTSSSTGSTKSQINPQVNSIKTHEAGYQHSLLQQLNSPSVLQALQFLQQPQQQQQHQKSKVPSISKTQIQNQEVQNQLLLYFQQAAIYQQQQQQQQFQHQQLHDQVIQQIQKLQQQQQPSQQFLHQQQLLLQGVHSRSLPPQAVQHLQKMMATYQLPPVSPTPDVQKQMQQHQTNQLSQTLPQQQEFSYQQPKKSSQPRDTQLQQQQHVSFDQHQLQSFLQQQHIAQFLQCQSSTHALTRPKSAVLSQQNHPYGTQLVGYKVDEQFCQTGQPFSVMKSAVQQSACGKEALVSTRGNSKVLLSTDEVSQQVQTSPQLTTPLPKSEPYDLTEARTSDIKLFGQSLLSQPASNAVNCISRASSSLSQQDQGCGSGAFAYLNGVSNAISGESCIGFGRPTPPAVAADGGSSLWHCSSSNLGFWYSNLNGLHSRSGSGVTEVQNAQEVETCRNEREVQDSEHPRFLSKEAASCRPRVQTSPSHHHTLDENKAVDPHLQRVSCDAKSGLFHTSRVDNVNLITKGSDADRVSSPGNIFETKSMASQTLKSVDTMMQQDWSNGSKHSEDVLFWESYRRDMLIDAVKRSALARQSGSEILQHMPLPSQILQVTGQSDNWGSLGEITASNVSLPATQRNIGYLPSATENVRHTDARGSDSNG